MADRPSVTLKINATGGAGAVDQLDDVAAAQDKVADATADAAKAAKEQGEQGAKAEGKLKKLFDGLKAGAGAAAGAAAGLTGMAVTLKGELSPETQTAVAGLQGLSGVLAAFGPLGALASVAVSGIATALALLDDTMELTKASSEGFLEGALKPMIEAMKTAADRADELTGSIKRMQVAAQSDFEVFTPDEVLQAERYKAAIAANVIQVQTLGREIEAYKKKAQGLASDGSSVWSPQADDMARRADALEAAKQTLAFDRQGLELIGQAARARAAGPATPSGGASRSPRINYEAEANAASRAAIEAAAAVRADRETDIYLQLSALDALKVQAVAAAAEVQAAWSSAWYGEQLTAAVDAGAQMQRDQLAAIEEQASALLGIYDGLTGGVMDFGRAAGEGFAAAAVAAAIYGGSLADAANQALQAATVTAATEALIATAKGLGYLAAGAFGYAPGLAAAQASFAAAGVWAAIAGGAALGAAATGGFGGGGGAGGPGSLGPGGDGPAALDRPQERDEPQDREFFINLASGQTGAPLSRSDAGAIATALVGIFRAGGMRLETRRA